MHDHKKNEMKQKSINGGVKSGKTIRFGVSADARLLEKFDEMIIEKSYTNRSEAIRDIIRDQLVEHRWAKNNDDVVLLLDAGDILSLPLRLHNPLLQGIGGIWVLMKKIIQLFFDEFINHTPHRRPLGLNIERPQFGFCLGLENRVLNADTDRPQNGCPNITGIEILFVKFTNGFDDGFSESGQVGAALGGVLPVYK